MFSANLDVSAWFLWETLTSTEFAGVEKLRIGDSKAWRLNVGTLERHWLNVPTFGTAVSPHDVERFVACR
jgi:hypothetical protein